MRGSPVQGRHRGATKLVRKPHNVWKPRVTTVNVGTLTGRSHELAKALERRRIDFCAVEGNEIAPPKPKLAERRGPARIKWWRLKDKEEAVVPSILLPAVTTVDETWKGAAEAITRVALLKLGVTKPGRRKLDKQTWLWTGHVRDEVRGKKKQHHPFLIETTADNWQRYQIAKKEAKKALAFEKAAHYADLNRKLESRDGERYVYRLAKTRNRQTEDIEKFFGINDENGHLLTDRRQTLKRWREYFANISTVEFANPAIPCAPPVHDPVQKITVNETITALKQMKSGRATGPDVLAADMWKSKGWNPTGWLTEFFNQVVAEKKVPESWQQSTTIPTWKKKGSLGDCTCYRPICLLSHSVIIFERIVNSCIRDIVELTTNQCGFVAGCSTIDAIHAARLLLEKHREKRRAVHLAFLDLEIAFDRVPRVVIWERFGVAPIVDKIREARLRWYGHTLRAKNGSVRKIGLNLDVSGKRPGGRAMQRWLDTLHEDLKAVSIHPDQGVKWCQHINRVKWCQHIRKADPAYKRDKR
nr:RNA-directed DNA polymerase (reverse transcriptase) domain containing protein [Haemonchus contortus]